MADVSRSYVDKLGDDEAKLLEEFRSRLPSLLSEARDNCEECRQEERLTLWGVDLGTPSAAVDMVLLKFLRAEELVLDKAAPRIVATLVFRAECQIDALGQLPSAELPEHFHGHDTVGGEDVDGRPLMVSRFGAMDLPMVFGDIEAFVRYRAHYMEKAIALLEFKPGRPEDLCQIHDYSGVPLLGATKEVKACVNSVAKVFTEHYPEFKGRTLFVNFPAAFTKLFNAFSLFLNERTKSKFIILGDRDHAELFKLITPANVPIAIGGLMRDTGVKCGDIGQKDGIIVHVRPRSPEEVEGLVVDEASTVVWELRVCYAEIAYEVVFVPVSGTEERVAASEDKEYLQAKDGVVSGEYRAHTAGTLKFRFRNECAWFKERLCLCRAVQTSTQGQ